MTVEECQDFLPLWHGKGLKLAPKVEAVTDWLLSQYQPRNRESLPPDIAKVMKDFGGPIKECFHTTQTLVASLDRAQYVEGFVFNCAIIPIEHAWIEVDGYVVELTLRSDPERKGEAVITPDPEWIYIGIPMGTSFVLHTMLERKFTGPLKYVLAAKALGYPEGEYHACF